MRRIEHPLFLLFTVALVGMLGTFVLSIGAAGETTGDVARAEAATSAPAGAADRADRDRPDPRPAARPTRPAPNPDTTILTVRPGATVELRDAPGGSVVATLDDTTEFGSPTVLAVAERHGRWAGVPTELLPNGKLGWVKVDPSRLAADSVGQSIVIDLSELRGELFRGEKLERRWSVGIGAPDTPTPTGHFAITDEIEGGLNPVYGCCAIALSATQPNLPAGWSGGNRIAIHGTSEPLGEANSTGCVHSGEDDLRALIEGVPLGTPVTIRR